jgi:hypothetical protein
VITTGRPRHHSHPPFTHGPASYLPRLEADYPGLSHGLVLVQWRPLVIPHAIIAGIFIGGWGWAPAGDNAGWVGTWGLIEILVVIAGVSLLFHRPLPARHLLPRAPPRPLGRRRCRLPPAPAR